MPALPQLGFDEAWQTEFASLEAGLKPYRISVEHGAQYALLGEEGHVWGELSGLVRRAAKKRLQRPAVGDWVAARPSETGAPARIEALLARRSQFLRLSPRNKTRPQIVAANVDVVLIVSSANLDFNLRRLERYLVTVYSAGAQPVLVLNKIDLTEEPENYRQQLETIAGDTPIALVSAKQELGLDELTQHLSPGRTLALVGSSGVGKSRMSNWILGEDRQEVGEIRLEDDKGRHTTTHRELFVVDHQKRQGILVDTPGMRELSLWSTEEGLKQAFAEIYQLEDECRFGDCTHQNEPGCAVRPVVDEARIHSFNALREEVVAQQELQASLRKR